MQDITTADGRVLHQGDRAFNFYDMKPGTIGYVSLFPQPDTTKGQGEPGGPGSPRDTWTNFWFDFEEDDGGISSLDGSRICSVEQARAKGWMQ